MNTNQTKRYSKILTMMSGFKSCINTTYITGGLWMKYHTRTGEMIPFNVNSDFQEKSSVLVYFSVIYRDFTLFPTWCNYNCRIVIAYVFCNKYKPFQTLYFVNNVLKLEWLINVRGYFGSCKVRGDIFINREIIPGPVDERICFTIY